MKGGLPIREWNRNGLSNFVHARSRLRRPPELCKGSHDSSSFESDQASSIAPMVVWLTLAWLQLEVH